MTVRLNIAKQITIQVIELSRAAETSPQEGNRLKAYGLYKTNEYPLVIDLMSILNPNPIRKLKSCPDRTPAIAVIPFPLLAKARIEK